MRALPALIALAFCLVSVDVTAARPRQAESAASVSGTASDVNGHVLTVTSNGQVVATYPLSAGRTNLPTMGGVHIAVFKSYVVRMVSTTPGDSYDELVYWDVNITDGGEFVHAAPWSTGAQGRSNVSHGCINLSVPNATTFYNFSLIGDIVNVVGSPRPASTGDHGTMDWTTPWAQWVPVSTQSPSAPAAPAPGPPGVA